MRPRYIYSQKSSYLLDAGTLDQTLKLSFPSRESSDGVVLLLKIEVYQRYEEPFWVVHSLPQLYAPLKALRGCVVSLNYRQSFMDSSVRRR